jgi:hypothetical protein
LAMSKVRVRQQEVEAEQGPEEGTEQPQEVVAVGEE